MATKHNQVIFTGNLVGEIKPSQTSGGKAVTYARLAVDLLGPDQIKTDTLWLGLTAYGAGAAQLAAFSRGARVLIEGKLDVPSVYVDASGQPQASLRVVTFAVTAAPLPVTAAPLPVTSAVPVAAAAPVAGAAADANVTFVDDDDLVF